MSIPLNPSDVNFSENHAAEEHIHNLVTSVARQCDYIAERFQCHEHLYESKRPLEPLRIVEEYLHFLARRSDGPVMLYEVSVERGYDMLTELFQWDLARGEELVTAQEAQLFTQQIRQQTEPWAILAFTNIEVPERRNYRLGSCQFNYVVVDSGIEGGVIFVGEQELAMIWFVDDDGPTRGMCDRRYR